MIACYTSSLVHVFENTKLSSVWEIVYCITDQECIVLIMQKWQRERGKVTGERKRVWGRGSADL